MLILHALKQLEHRVHDVATEDSFLWLKVALPAAYFLQENLNFKIVVNTNPTYSRKKHSKICMLNEEVHQVEIVFL